MAGMQLQANRRTVNGNVFAYMSSEDRKAHRPVMVDEVLDALCVRPGGVYVDGTLGGGGHSCEILKRSAPDGRVIGIDWDPVAIERARGNLASFGERILFYEGNYRDMALILDRLGIDRVHGVLLDLGASHEQLTSACRGFSLRGRGPLDMRYSPKVSTTAEEVLNQKPEKALREIFQTYGEERWAGRIARAIVRSRPLATTEDLAELVIRAVPGGRRRIHPATRVFQALRIYVNRELENLEDGIRRAAGLLRAHGRLCVLSYHSLEDRTVKHLFRELSRSGDEGQYSLQSRKPIRPTMEEIRRNPSARSAKLRVLGRKP